MSFLSRTTSYVANSYNHYFCSNTVANRSSSKKNSVTEKFANQFFNSIPSIPSIPYITAKGSGQKAELTDYDLESFELENFDLVEDPEPEEEFDDCSDLFGHADKSASDFLNIAAENTKLIHSSQAGKLQTAAKSPSVSQPKTYEDKYAEKELNKILHFCFFRDKELATSVRSLFPQSISKLVIREEKGCHHVELFFSHETQQTNRIVQDTPTGSSFGVTVTCKKKVAFTFSKSKAEGTKIKFQDNSIFATLDLKRKDLFRTSINKKEVGAAGANILSTLKVLLYPVLLWTNIEEYAYLQELSFTRKSPVIRIVGKRLTEKPQGWNGSSVMDIALGLFKKISPGQSGPSKEDIEQLSQLTQSDDTNSPIPLDIDTRYIAGIKNGLVGWEAK